MKASALHRQKEQNEFKDIKEKEIKVMIEEKDNVSSEKKLLEEKLEARDKAVTALHEKVEQ